MHRRSDQGASELPVVAVVLPLLVGLSVVCFDVGQWVYAWARTVDAARAGAAAVREGGSFDEAVRGSLSSRLADRAVTRPVTDSAGAAPVMEVAVDVPSLLGSLHLLPALSVRVEVGRVQEGTAPGSQEGGT